jgi:hypothetical protein
MTDTRIDPNSDRYRPIFTVADRAKALWRADLMMEPTPYERKWRTPRQWVRLAERDLGVELTPEQRKLASQIAIPPGD